MMDVITYPCWDQSQSISKRGHNSQPWASYQIRNIAGCACAGNAGNVSPLRLLQRKPLVSDPGMHHGTCVTHVPWCMSGSLTRGGGENVRGNRLRRALYKPWHSFRGNLCCNSRSSADTVLFIKLHVLFSASCTPWFMIKFWAPVSVIQNGRQIVRNQQTDKRTELKTSTSPLGWGNIAG